MQDLHDHDGTKIEALTKEADALHPNSVTDAFEWVSAKVMRKGKEALLKVVLRETFVPGLKYLQELRMRQRRSKGYADLLKPGETAELSERKKDAFRHPKRMWANIPLAGGKRLYDSTREEIEKYGSFMVRQGSTMTARGNFMLSVAGLLKEGKTPADHEVSEATFQALAKKQDLAA